MRDDLADGLPGITSGKQLKCCIQEVVGSIRGRAFSPRPPKEFAKLIMPPTTSFQKYIKGASLGPAKKHLTLTLPYIHIAHSITHT